MGQPVTCRLPPFALLDPESLVDRLEKSRSEGGEEIVTFRQWYARIPPHAVIRFRWSLACNSLLQRAAKGIQITPRADVAPTLELFEGCVAGTFDHRHGSFSNPLSRRSEIDQHRDSVIRDEDIAGLDVAVIDAALVEVIERGECSF